MLISTSLFQQPKYETSCGKPSPPTIWKWSNHERMVRVSQSLSKKPPGSPYTQFLKNTLLLLAPIIPFITDHVWRQLYSKHSIHIEKFSKPAWSKAHSRYTEQLLTFNREVWKIKEEKKLALRDSLEMDIPKQLKPFRADLVKMHSLITKT